MKILYLIMGARKGDLAMRNIHAIFESPIGNFTDGYKGDNEYYFIYYDGGYACDYMLDANHICLEAYDGIYDTFEKTVSAFRFLEEEKFEYDWVIRTNISQVVNLWMFDSLSGSLAPGYVYGQKNNTIIIHGKWENQLYTRGDMIIMDHDTVRAILSKADAFYEKDTPELDHTDDVLMGMCLVASDPEYYKRLRILKYAFLPFMYPAIENYPAWYPDFLKHCLGIRLKTIPPGKNSGWSWDDNEWRKDDCKKIRFIGQFLADKYRDGAYDCVKDVNDILESNDKIAPLEYHYENGTVELLKVNAIRRLLEEGNKNKIF